MSLVWFGELSKRSGLMLSRRKASAASGVWLLHWGLLLISWLITLLSLRCIQPFNAVFRKRRGRFAASCQQRSTQWMDAHLKPAWLSSSGVTVTVTPRQGQPHLVTIHQGKQTCSVYGLSAARVELAARGIEHDDLLMEWLWGLEVSASE